MSANDGWKVVYWNSYSQRELIHCGTKLEQIDALCEAVRNDNFDAVEGLCKSSISRDVLDGALGKRPLHIALIDNPHDYVDMILLLLDNGANINITDPDHRTILQKALSEQYNESDIKMLIDRGADVNCKDNKSKTVLHDAADCFYSFSIIKLLIDKGADSCAIDKDGRTTLHAAIQSLDIDDEVIKLLISKGANIRLRDNNGQTLLHLALETGVFYIIKVVMDYGGDFICFRDSPDTVIHIAIRGIENNHDDILQIIQLLVDNGANVNAKSESGYVPPSSNRDCVKRIILRSLHQLMKKRSGFTPLEFLFGYLYDARFDDATASSLIQTMKLLIDNGAVVDKMIFVILKWDDFDHFIWKAIHLTNGVHNMDMLKSLVKVTDSEIIIEALHFVIERFKAYGCEDSSTHPEPDPQDIVHVKDLLFVNVDCLDSVDSRGRTLLHKATWRLHAPLVRSFINAGLNVNAKDNLQQTPLHQICRKYEECEIDSQDYDEDVDTVGDRSDDNLKAIANLLIEAGANLDARTIMQHSPLFAAVLAQQKALVLYLCQQGADTYARDKKDNTPLDEAIKLGYTDIAIVLIDNGADVSKRDINACTPLHLFAKGGDGLVLQKLVVHGWLYALDCNGKTAMQHALNRVKTGKSKEDVIWPFLLQRGLQVDLFVADIADNGHVYRPEHLLIKALRAFTANDDDIRRPAPLWINNPSTRGDRDVRIIAFHRLIQCGCGINRKRALDSYLETMFEMSMFNILLYLMSAGIFPSFSTFEFYMNDLNNMGDYTVDDEVLAMECRDKMTEVRSLQLLCRDRVRQTLFRESHGSEIMSVIEAMQHVPRVLKDLLRLDGLESRLYHYKTNGNTDDEESDDEASGDDDGGVHDDGNENNNDDGGVDDPGGGGDNHDDGSDDRDGEVNSNNDVIDDENGAGDEFDSNNDAG